MKAIGTHYKLIPLIIIIILLATAVFITGCSGEAEEAPEVIAMQTELEPAAVPATLTPETAVLPTEEAEEEIQPDECLSCHIDKEMLIKTADPEEEVITENEGEG